MITAIPTVSVLMPVYNAERYVAEAVESILAQTFRDFEFLIIDDGSTDGSLAILKKYAARDERIRLISRPNTGIVGALNEGLEMARGDLIARMDADDVALPHRLWTQLDYLATHSECVMVGSRVIIIDPGGHPLTTMGDAISHEEIDSSLMAARGQMVYHPSVIIRRSALDRVGRYSDDYPHAEDLDLFLRLAEIGRIFNLPEALLMYREHYGKVGHTKAAEQWRSCRRAIGDAHARRGLPRPVEILERELRIGTETDKRRTWGWWALSSGHLWTCRRYAIGCLFRSPNSPESWRLLFCAIRGR